ncbi:MAG: hypothetical protein LBW77_04440, partial [Verrucomicrobiota bacterium]|nr:hypothetical protein [Verrucomicrobiota bacterium]
MHAITVTIENKTPLVVSAGTRISDLLPSVDGDGLPVLGAVVNNMVQPLFMPLFSDSSLAPLTIRDPLGWDIYRTSLCFLLAKTAHECFPGIECRVRNSIGSGLYCTLRWPDLSPAALEANVTALRQAMLETVRKDLQIAPEMVSYEAATRLFRETGQTDKLNLLAHRHPPP